MLAFFFFVFCLYFLFIVVLLAGWRQTPELNGSHEAVRITVIVPFRNEKQRILSLVEDLSRMNYPSEQFEVILVNDHVTDHSDEIVAMAISNLSNFKMLSLPAGKTGKKNAINLAVANASGDILITTDADCRVPVGWLGLIHSCFSSGPYKLVLGGVRISEDHLSAFGAMQALEFSSLIGVAGSTANLGFPTMCNGANLAFLKSAYLTVHGYEGNFQVASGDDEFLMRKIGGQFPGSVKFLASPESVVTTAPEESFRGFVQQRLRWAGKWKYNTSWVSRLLAVFVLVFQISFLTLMVLAVTGHIDFPWAFTLMAIKIFLEFLFLYRVNRYLLQPMRIHYFLALQFLYPLYVVLIGVSSLFLNPEWKGRKARC